MNITTITVSVHEKRNHPYEYGHYDAECRLTAELDDERDGNESGNVDYHISQLRIIARNHVQAECGAWIIGVNNARRILILEQRIENGLDDLARGWTKDVPKEYAHTLDLIEQLPGDLHARWIARLEDALSKGAELQSKREAAKEDNDDIRKTEIPF